MLRRLLACSLALLGAAAAVAQPLGALRSASGPSGLALSTRVEQVLAGADSAEEAVLGEFDGTPGATVIYTVTFENIGGRALDSVRITAPIPAELAYVANSAAAPGGRALFSIDGGRTFAAPAELDAGPERYTHVRWLLPAPIDPGARGFVRFRATVRAPAAAPEPAAAPVENVPAATGATEPAELP